MQFEHGGYRHSLCSAVRVEKNAAAPGDAFNDNRPICGILWRWQNRRLHDERGNQRARTKPATNAGQMHSDSVDNGSAAQNLVVCDTLLSH